MQDAVEDAAEAGRLVVLLRVAQIAAVDQIRVDQSRLDRLGAVFTTGAAMVAPSTQAVALSCSSWH